MKKVLCIIDVYNWAMHNRALALKKYLNKNIKIDIILYSDIDKISSFENYDIVYILNWILHKYIEQKIKKDRKYKLITTVCSHGKRESPSELKNIFDYYNTVTASSIFLYNELFPVYNKKIFYTPFGVDKDIFIKNTNPIQYGDLFGFVGKTDRAEKRYSDVVDAVKKSKLNLKTASHKSKFSQIQMNDFYNSIGTLICYSKSEGTPNPVLEGAACGRVVISTPVGNIPELFNKKYIHPPVKSKDELIDQIVKTQKDPGIIKACSDYLYNEVKERWTWDRQAFNFLEAFER